MRWYGVECIGVSEVGRVGWCGMRWGQVGLVRYGVGSYRDKVE